MNDHSSPYIRTRPQAAIILLLILLLLAAALSLIPAGMATRGSAAKAASDVLIYTNGAENSPIIGGFEDPVVTQRSKEADHLRLWAQMPALRAQTSWTTEQAIDLTGIDKVAVEWANVGTASTYNESHLIAATNSTDKAEDQALKFTRNSSFGTTIDRLDVSGINQPRYIRVHARDADAGLFSNPSSELNVYRIWLEPDPDLLEVNVSSSSLVGGTVSQSGHLFLPGASATVTAAAAANYAFVNWTEGGSVISTANPYTFNVDHNTNLVANFAVAQKIIYWNGTGYWPIIGGFQDEALGIPLAQREKRADHLWMWAEMPALRVQTSWTTEQAIDVTGIDQVAVEWENVGSNNELNESYLVAATNSSDRAEDQTDKLRLTQSFGRRVDRIDVSGINGPRYIRVHARDADPDALSVNSSELKVYKIWLEPPSCYEVKVSPSSAVGGTVTQSDHVFTPGASATVTAAAAANYEFVNWTEGSTSVSSNPSYTFNVNANRNLVANFRLIQRKIYWNGTEYFPIIGGFEDPVVTQREKRADHLWMWAEMPALRVQTSWTTGQPVDLTGINSIVVEWENVGSYSDYNESYLIAATNSSDKQEDQTVKFKRTLTFGRMIDRLDVTDINEPRYIRVHARDGSADDIIPVSSKLNVYRIWLESIRSVTPGSAVENTVVDPLVIVGSGFQTGATVKIEKTGTTKLATNVVVESATRITCRLDLAGAPLGTYDVIVTNPGGSTSSMIGGFKVTNVCGGGAAIGLSLFGLLMGFLTVTETVRSRRRKRK